MKKILLALNIIICAITYAQNNHSFKKQSHFALQNKSNQRLTQTNSLQQTQSSTLLDSARFWNWDTTAQVWRLTGRAIAYTFDAQNRNTGYLNQQLNGSIWVNSGLTTITYSNNTKTVVSQTWDVTNHVWVNNSKYTYILDANNNILSELTQGWNNNAWLNFYLSTNTYNPSNKITYSLYQNWSNNVWYNEERDIVHYNINNVQTDYSQTYWDSNNHQINDSLVFTDLINSNNDITSLMYTSWDFTTNAFDTLGRYIYTYDNYHNQVSSIYQEPYAVVGGVHVHVWTNADSLASTYSGNNLVTSSVDYSWINNLWFKEDITFETYDASGNNVGRSDKYRYGSTPWQGDSTYYYYSTITGINKLVDNNNLITIYPNPSKGNFTLETSMQLQSLKIYGVNGNLVLEQRLSNKKDIDISFLEDGVYNILLENNGCVINKKLIIVK